MFQYLNISKNLKLIEQALEKNGKYQVNSLKTFITQIEITCVIFVELELNPKIIDNNILNNIRWYFYQ